MPASKAPPPPSSGLPVDFYSAPAVDPTKNVLDLVSAAIQRQDDLRAAQDALIEAKLAHQREVSALRAEHGARFAELQAEHGRELREIESKRLDAVHESDSLNARIVADRQATTQDALMRKMLEDREALRSLVESTARTLALENASKASAMEARLLTLERAFSESKGKEAVADPQLATLATLVASLQDARSAATGKSAGLSLGTAILMGAAGLIATLLGIVAYLK